MSVCAENLVSHDPILTAWSVLCPSPLHDEPSCVSNSQSGGALAVSVITLTCSCYYYFSPADTLGCISLPSIGGDKVKFSPQLLKC